jgi:hypothetical protein
MAPNNLSVLQRAQSTEVVSDPYPFVVVHDALPTDLCDALIAEYPRLGILGVDAAQNNTRWSIPALDVTNAALHASGGLHRYHASPAFFAEWCACSAGVVACTRTCFLRSMYAPRDSVSATATRRRMRPVPDAQISRNTVQRPVPSNRFTST